MNEMTNEMTAETNEIASAFCTLASKAKKCNGKLPRVEYFRVDVDKGTGSADKWHATGYLLQVKVRGVDGMYCAGSVGAAYGMNVKSKYKTMDEAREAGMKMKREWGRVTVKAAKKMGKTLQDQIAEMTKDQRDQLLAMLMAS